MDKIRRFPPPKPVFDEQSIPIDQAHGSTVYQFQFGEFTIIFNMGGIWLERKGGERMDLHPGKFEKLLKKYWEKNF